MIALELSGVHIGKLLRISWKATNKDGSIRANARAKSYYVIPKEAIYHSQEGSITLRGAHWFDRMPEKMPKTWAGTAFADLYAYAGYRTDRRKVKQSSYIPFNAEVEVIGE